MGQLDGKVLLVTGAARGLGAVIARDGVAQGARVVLADVLDDEGASVAAGLGDDAVYVHLDVRVEADWAAGVALAESRFGGLDVLVNNAAVLRKGRIESFAVEEFREVFEVNQLGPFLGMRAVIPAMVKAGRGSIVNVGSIDAIETHVVPGMLAYEGSKWGLRGMTKVAAQELGPLNIRVNSVHPGDYHHEMVDPNPGREPADNSGKRMAKRLTPDQVKAWWALGRVAAPEEIASMVLFLASEQSTYTTGADIVCDGGATIGSRYVNA